MPPKVDNVLMSGGGRGASPLGVYVACVRPLTPMGLIN